MSYILESDKEDLVYIIIGVVMAVVIVVVVIVTVLVILHLVRKKGKLVKEIRVLENQKSEGWLRYAYYWLTIYFYY